MKRSFVSFCSPGVFVGLLGLIVLQVPGLCVGVEPVDFNREVRPLLSDRCFQCHGPDEEHRKGDLRLDLEDAATAEAIVPGQPDKSSLLLRITHLDADERMPPEELGKPLSKQEIELIRRWIGEGAEWSEHWAYVPPMRHDQPIVGDEEWALNWVDRFVLAGLEAEGLKPSADTDRATLIRRVTFDLTGLPPAPEEVEAFLEDSDPGAYEQLVDRLLESSHFGERMAVYWLDLVRFADTVGYHGDQTHSISPYRDYVIDAFNDGMRFDQFTREQLAGDLLADATIQQKVATGYNRLLQTSHEGGVQEKEYLAIYAADRVRNLSGVWMGATLGCSQCHDHKYDPYKAKDFYSMAAFFADVDEAQHLSKGDNSLPTSRPPEMTVLSRKDQRLVNELDEKIKELEAREDALETAGSGESLDQALRDLKAEREQIGKRTRRTMVTESISPRTIRVLPRGNWLDDSGPVVSSAIPEFLGRLEMGEKRASRLDLANWLTDPENGSGRLTARVFANRFWYLMFGVGLARVLDDFGGQGEPPVYPELLDNLSMEFVDNGWNVKQMMKLLAMSRAYRQSSLESEMLRERDPYNRLVARQSRYRMPAEMIRDNALAVSGLLVDELGGASVKPYQPAGYYRHLNFPPRTYQHDNDGRQWRRGVYVHWQRQFLHPMLKALDAPSREECTAERPRSNTPLAALTLMNDTTFVEAARVFAARLLREVESSDELRLDRAYLYAVSRRPDDLERKILLRLLESDRRVYKADLGAAKLLVQTGLAPVADDLDVAELAAWTGVARAILNVNETMTRN